MDIENILKSCEGFQWDKGNSFKSWLKHHVSECEAEQVFSNQPFLIFMDIGHSHEDARYRVLGYTDAGRFLFIVFTTRKGLVRIISARDMSKKERVEYENFKSNS